MPNFLPTGLQAFRSSLLVFFLLGHSTSTKLNSIITKSFGRKCTKFFAYENFFFYSTCTWKICKKIQCFVNWVNLQNVVFAEGISIHTVINGRPQFKRIRIYEPGKIAIHKISRIRKCEVLQHPANAFDSRVRSDQVPLGSNPTK